MKKFQNKFKHVHPIDIFLLSLKMYAVIPPWKKQFQEIIKNPKISTMYLKFLPQLYVCDCVWCKETY